MSNTIAVTGPRAVTASPGNANLCFSGRFYIIEAITQALNWFKYVNTCKTVSGGREIFSAAFRLNENLQKLALYVCPCSVREIAVAVVFLPLMERFRTA